MKPFQILANLGVVRGRGKRVPLGYLLKARNSRYLPEDPVRIWELLGRAKFNSTEIATGGGPEASTLRSIFPYYVDGGTSKLCVHKGGKMFEADLGGTGSFASAATLSALTLPRGGFIGYHDELYYTMNRGVSDDINAWHFWQRRTSGWRKCGFQRPVPTWTAAAYGSGSFASTTGLYYNIRIYDETTGTESMGGIRKSVTGPIVGKAGCKLTFTDGIAIPETLGTHLRIYRTLLNEPPGIYYRVDGSDSGIPLPIAPLYEHNDAVDNDTAQLYGTVPADGTEGEPEWAEYGGHPIQARGGVMFRDHLVLYGVFGRADEIVYSPKGLPWCLAVDANGVAQYWLKMSTVKQDRVMLCRVAGPYLLAFNGTSITRITHLPTYTDPGFTREIVDIGTLDHGVCGEEAADSIGIGSEDTKFVIYVSREHGIMFTNGVFFRRVRPDFDFRSLVNPSRWANVVVRNYPTKQEVWIFYSPAARTDDGVSSSNDNTEAVILDYSDMDRRGFRITWPVDVRCDDAVHAFGNDGEGRMYLLADDDSTIYVQDSGVVDQQKRVNASGHIRTEWALARAFPGGSTRRVKVARGMVMGSSGSAKTFAVSHEALEGSETDTISDTVQIGPGESIDGYTVNRLSQGHRVTLSRTGAPGSTYDESSASSAAALGAVELETAVVARQPRTRTA